MTQKARISDIGIGTCPCHQHPISYTTIFTSGARSVDVNILGTAVIGSIGISSCGHPTIATSGASTVFSENKQVHRLGDVGSNCGSYIVTTASPNVEVEQ